MKLFFTVKCHCLLLLVLLLLGSHLSASYTSPNAALLPVACDKNISLQSHRINHLSTEPIYVRAMYASYKASHWFCHVVDQSRYAIKSTVVLERCCVWHIVLCILLNQITYTNNNNKTKHDAFQFLFILIYCCITFHANKLLLTLLLLLLLLLYC